MVFQVNFVDALLLSSFFFDLTLAAIVFLKSPNRKEKLPFSMLTLCVASWTFGIFMFRIVPIQYSYPWNQMFIISAGLIPPTFLHFTLIFLKKTVRPSSLFLIYLPSAATVLGTFHRGVLIKEIIQRDWGKESLLGEFYPHFGIYFVIFMTFSFLLILKEFLTQKNDPTQRSRLKYLLIGTVLPSIFGAYFNLLLILAGDYRYIWVGPYCSFIFVSFLAYTILKYQLLDIEVIIRRTVVFAGLAGSVVAVVSLVAFVSQDLLGQYIGISRAWSNIFAAMIIAALYGRIRDWLVNATDKYLFQKKYDYRELLKTFMDEVMTVLDLRKLVELTTTTLSETIKLDSCALLLPNRATNRYEVTAAAGNVDRKVALEETHPLVKYLKETQEAIMKGRDFSGPSAPRNDEGMSPRNDRGMGIRNDEGMEENASLAVEEIFGKLKAEVCLPLAMRDELVGILALGHKKSDEPYTKEDLEILMTLAKTEAIALSNAQLAAEAAQKEKLAVIGTLAAAINHEVCNPLNNIKVQAEGFLLQLKRGLFSPLSREALEEKMAGVMQTTMQEIDRTAAITTRLSNFAKPVREPLSEPVNLDKVADEVISLLGHDLELREISIEKKISAGLPLLMVDHRQLQEILFNLMRNAGQAIGQKGRVTLRGERRGDSMVTVEVIDTGPGIPPEKLQRLFTPFFTTKGEGQGTGLGLFVIKRLVERNEGKILVSSTVGVGTTFTLEFPAALEKVGPTRAAA